MQGNQRLESNPKRGVLLLPAVESLLKQFEDPQGKLEGVKGL